MSILTEQLVRVANVYCVANDLKPSILSRRIFKSSYKLENMSTGDEDLTTKKWEVSMQYLSDNWPDGVAWPENINRPKIMEPAE